MHRPKTYLLILLTASLCGSNLHAQWASQQDARVYPSPNDLGQSDQFGLSVDLSGTTLIAGAELHDPSGGNGKHGAAYVFVRTASGWIQEAKLTSSSYDPGDRFGFQVALDGDTAVVGAPFDDNDNALSSGAAYVFARTAGVWSEEARLVASDKAVLDNFGASVSIDGDSVAIGADRDSTSSLNYCGSVYVFVRNGTTWTQEAKLVASDAQSYDELGQSVVIRGDTVVAGAWSHDTNGLLNSGAAYVFERNGSVWSQSAKLTASDGAGGDWFGMAVALEADTLVVGAPRDDGAHWDDGSAYVFARNGSVWTEQVKLTDFQGQYHDEFGSSVDIEGDRIAVGLPWAGISAGSVELFSRTGSVWTGELEMIGSDCDGNDYLGSSVALSGDLLVGGTPGGETPPTGLGTGELYVFEIVPPPLIESYCLGKPNSLGCVPAMSWSGVPSASNPLPFTLECINVLSFKTGLLFYGHGAASLPFQGGTLCVAAPILRTLGQNSLGTPPPPESCTGAYSYDMNALIQSGTDPSLVAGANVYCQYWMRDPVSQSGSGLSDAVHFEIDP